MIPHDPASAGFLYQGIYMNEIFLERSKKYKKALKDENIQDLWAGLLLKKIIPNQQSLNRVIASVVNYINDSLNYTSMDPLDLRIQDRVKLLDSMASVVHKLPNLTPNGALYTKKELVNSYNQMCSSVVDYVNVDKLDIDLIAPPTVRIKTSKVPNNVSSRKTYTGIPHSDAWVGHHGSGVISMIVIGDVDKLGVSFYEPIEPNENYLTNVGDFNIGNETYKEKRFITSMTLGDIFLFDHAVLHKTNVDCSGEKDYVRVSIDMAYKIDKDAEEKGISMQKADLSRFKYLSEKDFKLLGKEKFVVSPNSIFDDSVINQKAGAFLPSSNLFVFKEDII